MISLNLDTPDLDLADLEQPAISVLTKIQSHGVLLVLQEPELTVLQVSDNTGRIFGIAPAQLLGKTLGQILDAIWVEQFKAELAGYNLDRTNPHKVWVRKAEDDYNIFDAVFHRSVDGFLVLELEPAQTNEQIPFLSFYHLAKAAINQSAIATNLTAFGRIVVHEVRKLTGFDRVMLYKFDDDRHGEVIAETKLAEMESYLGLHFPESDIPQPARELFLSNRIRAISNAGDTAVELVPAKNPQIDRPTDLTLSILRSAFPCHLEYLQNMGVGASLTISLIEDGKLWGLIVCHHRTPKIVPYELRKACEFLGQVIFAEISLGEEVTDLNYRSQLADVQSMLIDRMSRSGSFIDGLVAQSPNLLDLVNAQGAAIYFGGNWTTIGKTPSGTELNCLLQWLTENVGNEDEVFATNSLALMYADAHRFKDVASGLLAIPLSHGSYVLWCRSEVIQTVNWGGNPHHAYRVESTDGNRRLHPRKSFELWKETVRLQSFPWKASEVAAARELRKAIVNIVLRQAEELALLAADLARSNAELKKFAYVASHDLQEPLNQVANYVQLLEMRYGEQLDRDAKEFIGFAVEGVHMMQTLIDDVLAYSKVELLGIAWESIEVETALNRALRHLSGRIEKTGAIVTFDPMPTIVADSTQLMQLFQNLIGNAIKFCKQDETPQIHISVNRQGDNWLFTVRDNGIGIDPQFSDRIFTISQRLHTREEYPGSGMGLTICKKIIECHQGQIWVTSELGLGSTFSFTIPVSGGKRNHVNRR
jgi:two-component system, chemotaxis family, sensor kinase Cph1